MSVTALIVLLVEAFIALTLGLLYVLRTDRMVKILQRWNRDRLAANQSWLGWSPRTMRQVGWALIVIAIVAVAVILVKEAH
jgi:hypothetical protein